MLCACIYNACSINNVKRSNVEIANMANINNKIVTKCINIFNKYNINKQ